MVTNAGLERKGARTALVTTRGFHDTLEIGTEHCYDMYDLEIERPRPLVPRRLRLEAPERIWADGRSSQGLVDAGCTYLVIGPTMADPAQIDRLAKEVAPRLT
jgi:N-methylhydantoinase A